jgi:hypothetical protein
MFVSSTINIMLRDLVLQLGVPQVHTAFGNFYIFSRCILLENTVPFFEHIQLFVTVSLLF